MAIVKVFFDVPGGLGLPGLTALAQERKVRIGDGKFVMFMNRRRSAVKIVLDERSVFCYRKPSGEISLEELREIPYLFKQQWMAPTVEGVLTRWLNKPVTSIAASVSVA